MKNYNVENYVRYKRDYSVCELEDKPWIKYTRDELIIVLMPYAEKLCRQFSTADRASGVMSMLDIMQEAFYGLTAAVDRIDWSLIINKDVEEDVRKQIKGFVKKRILGSARRNIDMNRGDIRIPEHKLNEIRRSDGRDKKMIQMFFNSVFLSMDDENDKRTTNDFEDKSYVADAVVLNLFPV